MINILKLICLKNKSNNFCIFLLFTRIMHNKWNELLLALRGQTRAAYNGFHVRIQ